MNYNDLQSILGYDILSPMYQSLGGQGNPFMIENQEGGANMLLGGNQAAALGFDPSFFDPYSFEWNASGPGNSGQLTAFQDGNQVWQGGQYDTPFSETLRDGLLTAGAAFGGLGLAGAGPFSGLGSLGGGSSSLTSGFGGAGGAGGGMSGWNFGIPNFGMGGIDPSVLTGGAGGAAGSWIPGISNSSLLSVGGNLLSGFMGQRAAGKASDAMLTAGRESNALMKAIYDQQRADNEPFRQAGVSAIGGIQNLLANPGSLTSDPGYQFGLNEGVKARDMGAAGRGMTYSGPQAKALTQYGNDYAGTKLNEAYNRLASIAGIGQQANSQNMTGGMNYGNNAGNVLQQMGNARGSSYIGKANSWADAFGNIINDQQQQDAMKQWGGGGW